jgi:roadblock/LC7 domain-containing protein
LDMKGAEVRAGAGGGEHDLAKTLDELLKITGVIAAGEFRDDGSLVDVKGKIERKVAEMAAQMSASTTRTFKQQAEQFTQASGMKWTPAMGWAFTGGDYTIAVMGNKGVFVETAKIDFNKLFQELLR